MDRKSRFLELSPVELLPNPWNTNSVSPDNMEKLKLSMEEFGAFKPVIVRETEDGYEIIGGQHRSEAAAELGWDKIPVMTLGVIDDTQAKKISLIDNGRYGSDDAFGLASLLEELQRDSDVDLATYMPFTSDELDRILTSVEVDLDSIGMDDEDLLGDSMGEAEVREKINTASIQTHQLMRFKVPVEEAEIVSDEIQRIMREHGLVGGDVKENAGEALSLLVGECRRLRSMME